MTFGTHSSIQNTNRGGDVSYLLPVLGGLTKEEIETALPPLVEKDLVDEKLLKRLIIPAGPLTAAEALVALHNVDPEKANLTLKKYLDTLQKCLGMKTLFPQTALTLALVKMVEDKALPVPYAYMRSVILAIRAYPTLKSVVADSVVPKLVEREVRHSSTHPPTHPFIHSSTHPPTHPPSPTKTTQVWTTQPRVWEGLILLPKYIGTR